MNILRTAPFALLLLTSCSNKENHYDASGTFEAEEVIVSSETSGRILQFLAEEGEILDAGDTVVYIDTTALYLQARQLSSSRDALQEKTMEEGPLLRMLQQQKELHKTQLQAAERERERVAKLLREDAATQKQLQDLETQVALAQQQLSLSERQLEQQRSALQTQNRSILSESTPLQLKEEQVSDQLRRATVRNPVQGTVLTVYARAGEVTAPGKALYKIADLREMILRAYVSGDQLPALRIGQALTVLVDRNKDEYVSLPGTLSWISDKAEFTPKTIQTKDERAQLVYAIKIRVKNKGIMKIGMYGEVRFPAQP